jgi:hypothetical protein
MADLMNDGAFAMQPQRRPMGLFRSPALSGQQTPISSGVGGGGGAPALPTADAMRARLPGAPRGPIAPIRRAGPFTASPASATAPAPAAAAPAPTSPTPLPNVPLQTSPYTYSGPTMSLLGTTDFLPATTPASPLGGAPRGADGGGFLDRVFSGRRQFLQ